jgi:hypothetical protein
MEESRMMEIRSGAALMTGDRSEADSSIGVLTNQWWL